MSSNLQFDFSVDKEKKVITVKREFPAPVEKVWAAWTEASLLDQWWAPKPYQAVTKSFDFREGGHWLYAMEGPDNFKQWSRAQFHNVVPLKSYSGLDVFCDEDENIDNELPQTRWTNSFSRQSDKTLVTIVIEYDTIEDLEKLMDMGFQEGFTAGMENLDALLESSAA